MKTAAGLVVLSLLGCKQTPFSVATDDAATASIVVDAGYVAPPLPLIPLADGHAPFYAAVAKLVKDPRAGSPVSETDETFQGVAYTFYKFGFQPLTIPINNIELRVRKSNHAAWSFVVRPGDDPGIVIADFAPAGGTASMGVDTGPNDGTSADEIAKHTALEYAINKGPLAGGVVFLFGDKTLSVKSHAEAYAK